MHNNLLAELSLQQLRETITIREKIEALENELESLFNGRPSTTEAAARRKKRKFTAAARARLSAAMKSRWTKRKGKQRATKPTATKANAPLTERIVGTLKAAGKSGATVKDLAAKLGKSYGSVSVWFYTTGKGIKGIKKVEPGRFAWAP